MGILWGAVRRSTPIPGESRVLIRHAEADGVGACSNRRAGRIVFSYGFLDRKAAPAGDSRVTIGLVPLGHSTRPP